MIIVFLYLTSCVCVRRGFARYVLLGELDYASDDDDAAPLQFNIVERIRHPNYTGKFKYNDIALLRLESTVPFNDYIRPACLPESSSIGFNAKATGWGRLDFDRPVTSHLQKVELDLFTYQECDELYAVLNSSSINRGIVNETQICAGTQSGRGDTCQVSFEKLNAMIHLAVELLELAGCWLTKIFTRKYFFIFMNDFKYLVNRERPTKM